MGKRIIKSENQLLKREQPIFVKDMIGLIYDRLTVVSYAGYYKQPSGNIAHYIWCKCSCGKNVLGNTTEKAIKTPRTNNSTRKTYLNLL